MAMVGWAVSADIKGWHFSVFNYSPGVSAHGIGYQRLLSVMKTRLAILWICCLLFDLFRASAEQGILVESNSG